jgi:hypothetical protein
MTGSNKQVCLEVKKVINEITNQDISKKLRKRKIVEARGIYFTILRDIYGMPYQAIGDTIGMNHASVLHSCKNFKYWLITNKQLRDYTNEAYNVIKGITTIEDSRDTLTTKLYRAEATIKQLQRSLKQEINVSQHAVERYQNELMKIQKASTLEIIMKNKKVKSRFPNLIEQIKSELNRRYR